MSILAVLVVVVGVAGAKFVGPPRDAVALQPIATTSQARRICAELCMAGLGGEPCGEACLDILPQGLPLQSAPSSQRDSNATRRDACSVLCANQLGYPLCECDASTERVDSRFRVDFVQICGYFCLKYSHRIYGCQACEVYRSAEAQHGGPDADVFGFQQRARALRQGVDWEAWCKVRCVNGDGGAACNCDILPFALDLKDSV